MKNADTRMVGMFFALSVLVVAPNSVAAQNGLGSELTVPPITQTPQAPSELEQVEPADDAVPSESPALTGGYVDPLATGGPEALLCRPQGQGPFPTVVWSHGRVSDQATLDRGRTFGWRRLCQALAEAGFLAFIPVRDIARGNGPQNVPYNVGELSSSVNYVLGLREVDPARIALMGHSRGALLTLLVGLDRRELKALILTAPADIPPYFAQAASRVRELNTPVLLMVEASDEEGSVAAVNRLDQALHAAGKDLQTIHYDRGGGHYLFITFDYWWEDLIAFLRDRLG